MQWEAFFHSYDDNLSAIRLLDLRTEQFWDGSFPALDPKESAPKAPKFPSHREFGKDVHAADLGRHPVVASLLFYPDDGRLAADPALLARGQLGWEY